MINADRYALAWIAAGSNLGERDAYLAAAREALHATAGIRVVAATLVEETAPLGGLDQPLYLNQMLMVETILAPPALLQVCHAIEQRSGRSRTAKWDSRTLDLDLVRYADMLCDRPDLTLPHPGLRDRAFWAREIAMLEAHV